MKRFTLFLKRIFIITMAAFMLVFSPVSAFASTSMAAELVAGYTLEELLAEFLLQWGVAYLGYESLTYNRTVTYLQEFAATPQGAQLIRDYYDWSEPKHVGGSPNGSDGIDYLFATVCALTIGTPLFILAKNFFSYCYENDSQFAASADRPTYIQYDCLPDNVYIGRYLTSVYYTVYQGVLEHDYDWYDGCVTFVPSSLGTSDGHNFTEILVNNDAHSSAGYKYHNLPTSYCINLGCSTKFSMCMTLLYTDNNQFNVVNGYENNRNGFFSVITGSVDSDSFTMSAPWTYAYWPNCTSDRGNFYIHNCYASLDTPDGLAVVMPNGSLYLDSQPYTNGHCVSDTGSLTNAGVIVGQSFLDYINSLSDEMVANLPTDEIPSLTRDQLQSITNNVSNYYDQTATNYYEDISYITGDTYIENVVNNYYNPPAVDTPAVPDTGFLSELKLLFDWLYTSIKLSLEYLGDFVVDGVKALFIPEQAVIDDYISIVLENFKWIDDFKAFAVMVTDVFSIEPEVPKIPIDFSKSDGRLHNVGKTYALDMTWYAPYKKTVDDIIVSVCWLLFAWWGFRNIPEIIAGNSTSRVRVKEGD